MHRRLSILAIAGLFWCSSAHAQALPPSDPAILVKDGAQIAGLHPALKATFHVLAEVWLMCGVDAPVVTSGVDSFAIHRQFSLHLYGRAIDIRGRSHTSEQVSCIKRELPSRLPTMFYDQGSYQLIWETPKTHRTNAPHWHLAFQDLRGGALFKVAAGAHKRK